jgi:hypothetical protein
LLKEAGWLIPYGEDIDKGVTRFFQHFDIKDLVQKKEAAQKIAKKLNADKIKVFQEIAANIQNLTLK